MVRINTIYTRTGDDGATGLIGGRRVRKTSVRVCAFGEVDELNAHIGHLRTEGQAIFDTYILEQLENIQNELFDIGAVLASDPTRDEQQASKKKSLSVDEESILRLERCIDHCVDGLPDLRSFILPGGSSLNSACHIARCVCRRAERSVWHLAEEENDQALSPLAKYINRLSDLLFALARRASYMQGVPEYLWKPAATKSQTPS